MCGGVRTKGCNSLPRDAHCANPHRCCPNLALKFEQLDAGTTPTAEPAGGIAKRLSGLETTPHVVVGLPPRRARVTEVAHLRATPADRLLMDAQPLTSVSLMQYLRGEASRANATIATLAELQGSRGGRSGFGVEHRCEHLFGDPIGALCRNQQHCDCTDGQPGATCSPR